MCNSLLQSVIISLFALSLYVKMWEHSISTFAMLVGGAVACILYSLGYSEYAALVVTLFAILVTLRGAMKPRGERFL